jgi:hypothetical protein
MLFLFPEKELCGLNPNFHIHVFVRDLHIPKFDQPIFLQQNRQTDQRNIQTKKHTNTNIWIGTVAAQFLSWDYLFRIFCIVSLWIKAWSTVILGASMAKTWHWGSQISAAVRVTRRLPARVRTTGVQYCTVYMPLRFECTSCCRRRRDILNRPTAAERVSGDRSIQPKRISSLTRR